MDEDDSVGDSLQYRTGFHHGMDHAAKILAHAETIDEAKRLLSIYERVCRDYRCRTRERIYQGHDGTRETLERFKSNDPYRNLPQARPVWP